MKVGDLVRWKTTPVYSTNPIVLVVKVWPGEEVQVSVIEANGQRVGRFGSSLEIVSAAR